MNISVALCTYNGSRFLGEQLQSIALQTRLPDELVISDDGSSDNTVEIARQFAEPAGFPVSIVQNPHNLGVAGNFQHALTRCTGDILVLSDQDDVWLPEKLARFEQIFKANLSAGMAFCNAEVVSENGDPLGFTLWQSVRFSPAQQQTMLHGQAASVLLQHPVVTGATMAFRASLLQEVLPIPPEWIHDEWIALLIAGIAPIIPIAETLMQYRVHGRNQVGAERVGLKDRLRTALSTDRAVYQKRATQFNQLAQHMRAKARPASQIAQVEGKRDFMHLRGTLPHTRLARIMPVLRALVRGDYACYSASNLNALRDLLLQHRAE